jgi:hypothetical protein
MIMAPTQGKTSKAPTSGNKTSMPRRTKKRFQKAMPLAMLAGLLSVYLYLMVHLRSLPSNDAQTNNMESHLAEKFRISSSQDKTKTKPKIFDIHLQEVRAISHSQINKPKGNDALLLDYLLPKETVKRFEWVPGNSTHAARMSFGLEEIRAASHQNNNTKPRPKFATVNTSFYNISSDGTNLWDTDPKIPEWMKAYMNWHKWKRTTWNTQTNWTSERWLIMQCFGDQDNKRCGGTADRLKPVPFMLRTAYNHQRMLLIRWTRPAMLEEFLVPPKGGFDWRVPEWMANVVSRGSYGLMCISIGFDW